MLGHMLGKRSFYGKGQRLVVRGSQLNINLSLEGEKIERYSKL
jgi:hypothetical protein